MERAVDIPLTFRADLCQDYDDLDIDRGEFAYRVRDGVKRYITFWPRDCATPLCVAIRPHKLENGASWEITGAEDAPTLQPSVNAEGIWHGFLTNGIARQ